jgi:hypothetical protein
VDVDPVAVDADLVEEREVVVVTFAGPPTPDRTAKTAAPATSATITAAATVRLRVTTTLAWHLP